MFNLNKIQKLYNIVKCNNLHFHNVEKVPVRSITKKSTVPKYAEHCYPSMQHCPSVWNSFVQVCRTVLCFTVLLYLQKRNFTTTDSEYNKLIHTYIAI